MSSSTSIVSGTANPSSAAEKLDELTLWFRQGLAPPMQMSVPDWADEFRKMSSTEGSREGDFQTSTVEVARGPMMAVTEPGVRGITVQSCTQLLKTTLLMSTAGYFAHLDPCPILIVQPKDAAAKQFSKERVEPMIASTPVLRELIDGRGRSADDTIQFKQFPGGFIAVEGAGSPDNLARRPIRVLLMDEINKYLPVKGGRPTKLAKERLTSFRPIDSLWIEVCSPDEDEDEITVQFNAGDQRRASCCCPKCGHRQFLDFFKHVEWDKDRDAAGQVLAHRPETAAIACERCHEPWTEAERLLALRGTRWYQTKAFVCCGVRHDPLADYERLWRTEGLDDAELAVWRWVSNATAQVGYALCSCCGSTPVPNRHASFTASKLFSPNEADRPSELAHEWLVSKDNIVDRQTFYNAKLGLPYSPQVDKKLKSSGLLERREVFAAEVPDGVAMLTAGVDVQGDRLEIEIVGWGRDEESWSIAFEVIDGDLKMPETVARLDALLARRFLRADGRPFVVEATCIDSSDQTNSVYTYSKERLGRRIWAIKGRSERDGIWGPVWPTVRPSPKRKDTFKPVMIGVNTGKLVVRSRLADTAAGLVGPGYCHFPHDRDVGYFEQLLSEQLRVKTDRGGRRRKAWTLPDGLRNEALDCRNYAYAALCGLIHMGWKLNRTADEIGAAGGADVVLVGSPEAARLEQARRDAPLIERTRPDTKPPAPPGPAKSYLGAARSEWNRRR